MLNLLSANKKTTNHIFSFVYRPDVYAATSPVWKIDGAGAHGSEKYYEEIPGI